MARIGLTRQIRVGINANFVFSVCAAFGVDCVDDLTRMARVGINANFVFSICAAFGFEGRRGRRFACDTEMSGNLAHYVFSLGTAFGFEGRFACDTEPRGNLAHQFVIGFFTTPT